jgi:hypothetical protein
MLHGNQIRRRGWVAVPEVVVDKLVVPKICSGPGIKRKQAVGVEVISVTVSTVEIRRSRACGNVNDSQVRV